MTKLLLALGVAVVTLTATPSEARRHHAPACAKWRHGHCVAYVHVVKPHARHARYRVGYVFGPRYGYTAYSALPRTYVTRYHLVPRYRYVYTNGYIYVVDPATWAVIRILNAF